MPEEHHYSQRAEERHICRERRDYSFMLLSLKAMLSPWKRRMTLRVLVNGYN